MITKVKRIKNLGIFRDFKLDNTVPDFQKYTLIYGWNGCGKTTFSRLFSSLEEGQSPDYPNLEYQVESSTGTFKNSQKYPRKVRVFNQQYIIDNAPSLENPSTETKHIFILGKEDKQLAEQIKLDLEAKTELEDSLTKDDRKTGVTSLTTQKQQKEKSKNTLFTDIAKVIASSRGRAFRDYDRRDALKAYDKLTQKEELDEKALESCQSVIEQKVLDKVTIVPMPTFNVEDEGKQKTESLEKHLSQLIKDSSGLLSQTVQQNVIKRLAEHTDIAEWVATGVAIHESHKSKSCEYCGQAVPEKRLKELAEHFNDAHKNLITSIDDTLVSLRELYAKVNTLQMMDKSNLYEHLREDYDSAKQAFEKSKQEILQRLTDLGNSLNDKKTKSHEAMDSYEFNSVELEEKIKLANKSIEAHNKICDNFEQTTADAKIKLEKHYVSTVYDEAKKLEKEIEGLGAQITTAQADIKALAQNITGNQATIRNSKIACDKINQNLEKFLGRKEISFEDSNNGYLIKRGDEEASHLSEGEKTAIAFVYFIISLESDDFDLKEGIVFVDDPISSFDSNSIFQAFAFLKSSLAGAHQLFICTHNFEFLRLIINWLSRVKDKSYLMINNKFEDDERCAYICKLDDLLKDHESEYHYLFKMLYEFRSDGTIASVYNIPNIARKVLDTFLMFRVPNSETTYKKMTVIPFDDVKKTAIYKFTNDQSHITGKGFDPALVPETQNNVKHLLEMIEAVFPEHYKILTESLKS